jgi:ABC-type glycerol-3-phosphate transport system permease component
MKKKKIINSLIHHIVCILLALIMVYPIAWLLFSAFKDQKDIFSNAGRLLPEKWIFNNFQDPATIHQLVLRPQDQACLSDWNVAVRSQVNQK